LSVDAIPPLAPGEQPVGNIRITETGYLGMVNKRKNLPTSGGFSKGNAYGRSIHARLELRPVPILALDHRLAVAIAVLAPAVLDVFRAPLHDRTGLRKPAKVNPFHFGRGCFA
jgi:hypothetical protein